MAAVWFVAAGLACLLAPFRDFATESVAVDTVAFTVVGFAEGSPELADTRQVDAEGNGKQFVGILRSLDEMVDEAGSGGGRRLVRTTMAEAMAFLPPKPESDSNGDSRFSFRYRGNVFEAWNAMGKTARAAAATGAEVTPELEATVQVEWRGRVAPVADAVVLADDALADRPTIRAFLEGEKLSWEMTVEDFPRWSDWEALVTASDGAARPNGKSRVVFGGRVLEVEPDRRYPDEKKIVPGLRTGVKALGGILCLSGAILLGWLYRRPGRDNAIPIGSPGYQLVGDLIVIVIAGLAMTVIVDSLLGRWCGIDRLMAEAEITFLSGFFLVLAVPLVSLYQSSLSAQSLRIDANGVRLESLFSDKRLAWDQLEEVRVMPVRMVTARLGVPVPRTLSKNLVLAGGGEELSVMEPSRSKKRRIIRELAGQAPEGWKEKIREAGKEWEPYAAW